MMNRGLRAHDLSRNSRRGGSLTRSIKVPMNTSTIVQEILPLLLSSNSYTTRSYLGGCTKWGLPKVICCLWQPLWLSQCTHQETYIHGCLMRNHSRHQDWIHQLTAALLANLVNTIPISIVRLIGLHPGNRCNWVLIYVCAFSSFGIYENFYWHWT